MPDLVTAAEMHEIVSTLILEDQFTERNKWIVKARSYLDRTADPTIPGMEDLQLSFHSPKPGEDAAAFTEKLVAVSGRVSCAAQVKPGGPETDLAAKRAQRLENMIYRLLERWRPEIERAVYSMVALKRGWLYLHLNKEVLGAASGKIPEPKPGEDPEDYAARPEIKAVLKEFSEGERSDLFEVEHVPADAMYWTPDRAWKIFAAQVPLPTLNADYGTPGAGGYLGEKGKRKRFYYDDKEKLRVESVAGAVAVDAHELLWSKTVTLYICANATEIYHYVLEGAGLAGEGHLIGCYKNYFGTPPFIEIRGRPKERDHALHGTSALIEGLYETEPILGALGKLIMSAGVEAAQNQKVLEAVDSEWGDRMRQRAESPTINREANGLMHVTPGWALSQYRATLPSDVLDAFRIVMAERENYGISKLITSPEEFDAKSGYDRSKATDAVTSQLDPALARIADAEIELAKAVKAAIVELGIPIPVRNVHPTSKLGAVPRHVQEEITVDPEDAKGDVDISIRFDSKTQYSKIAEVETWLPLVGTYKSPTWFMTEVLGEEDPERARREIAQDKMRGLADEQAFTDAVAMFKKLQPFVEGEAIAEAELEGLVALAESQYGGQNGAGGGGDAAAAAMQPVTEPPPNMEAELGMAGVA